jgi:hypothetical protein
MDEPVVAQLRQAPILAIQPTGEEVQLAQVVTPPPAEVAQVVERKLPESASPMPLIALCGLLALGSAFVIRSMRKSAL